MACGFWTRMGMKYSSGPQVPTMAKDGPDSVEIRSRAGDGRQFSPSAARNCACFGRTRVSTSRIGPLDSRLQKRGGEQWALETPRLVYDSKTLAALGRA